MIHHFFLVSDKKNGRESPGPKTFGFFDLIKTIFQNGGKMQFRWQDMFPLKIQR
jgi:hypothetical protein